MKAPFDRHAQLVFGTAVGDLLRRTQARHAVRQEDLIMLLCQITAGWALDAHMHEETLLKMLDAAYRSAHNGLITPPQIKVV